MQTIQSQTWSKVLLCLIAFLLLYTWSSLQVRQRVERLHSTLDNAYSSSLALTRSLGYGGLIHHFKNQLLRPGETHYKDKARVEAGKALAVLDSLTRSAERLSISPSLTATRAMINAYTARLDRLDELQAQGLNTPAIDTFVRYDDTDAIGELDGLIAQVRHAIKSEVQSVEQEERRLFWIGVLVIALIWTIAIALARRQRDMNQIANLNSRLAESVDRLDKRNCALNQFAGIVSHDLKAPLRHINYFGSLIVEDVLKPDAVKEHVASIDKSICRMGKLIDCLLEFSKAGFSEPRFEPVDIEAIADDAVHELAPSIERSGAEVSLSLSGSLLADPSLLSRVFENLIGNSLKYARQDAPLHLDISATKDDRFMHITFTDNGIGIPAVDAERVFQPFQRLHSSRSQYTGNGLGLALVKAIIEAHGGTVRVDSDYPHGTRIVVSLMVAPVVPRQARQSAFGQVH